MAKLADSKKRKASAPELDAEKMKKVKKIATVDAEVAAEAPAKKRKATEDASSGKAKKTKKTAGANVVVEEAQPTEPVPAEPTVAAPKAKKGKKVTSKPAAEIVSEEAKEKKVPVVKATSAHAKLNAKGTKKSKADAAKVVEQVEEAGEDSEDDEGESDIDDQTEALLQGFESDEDEEDAANGEGYTDDKPMPKAKLSKAEKKKLKQIAETEAAEKPGVVYVGRIPHGFYEHEMIAYCSQFGKILKLRISRNKKTGGSRHYGWIQFASTQVAEIFAKTMDNYLLFGHLLKVKLISDEQVPTDLFKGFKGVTRRFVAVPWNKMEGRKLNQGASEEVWNSRIEREEKRRVAKAEKLKAIGYEFEAPKIKSADGVSKNHKPKAELVIDTTDETPAIEGAAAAEGAAKPKVLSKRTKKTKATEATPTESVTVVTEETKTIEAVPAQEGATKPKAKKGKKAKATEAVITETETVAITSEVPAVIETVPEVVESDMPKAKRAKKAAATTETVIVAGTVPEVTEAVKPKAKRGKKAAPTEVAPEIEAEVAETVAEVPEPVKPKAKRGKKAVAAEIVPEAEEEVVKPKKEKKSNLKKAAEPIVEEAPVVAEEEAAKPKTKKKGKKAAAKEVEAPAEAAEEGVDTVMGEGLEDGVDIVEMKIKKAKKVKKAKV